MDLKWSKALLLSLSLLSSDGGASLDELLMSLGVRLIEERGGWLHESKHGCDGKEVMGVVECLHSQASHKSRVWWINVGQFGWMTSLT